MDEITVGVCWFDDPKIGQSGWASEAGSPAARISGTNALRTDVVWVTNIDFKNFRALNLTATPYLRDSQYFRSGLDLLAKELGVIEDIPAAVEAMSRILNRTARIGREWFGLSPADRGYRYSPILAQKILPGFVRERPAQHTAAVEEAARQSTQANQAMTGQRRPLGSAAQSFVFPRTAYARWLLSQPVPVSNSWREVKFNTRSTELGHVEGEQVKGGRAVFEKLLELSEKKAVLLRVQVLNMDGFYRPFATFGAGCGFPRAWATLPEILELSRYARLDIAGGFSADIGRLDEGLIGRFAANEYAFSRGLVYENLLVALATFADGKTANALAAYLRAYDRIVCGKAAAQFARQTLTVGSYGTGRVTVYLRKHDEEDAARLALNLGLLPPIGLLKGRIIHA